MILKRAEIPVTYENYIKRNILGNFNPTFAFVINLEHNLRENWNFCLVWKLHQAGDIT